MFGTLQLNFLFSLSIFWKSKTFCCEEKAFIQHKEKLPGITLFMMQTLGENLLTIGGNLLEPSENYHIGFMDLYNGRL